MPLELVTPDVAMLDAALAEDWQLFPEALRATRDAVAADPGVLRWGTRMFMVDGTLVGWGGFKGAPRNGVVELGYAIAPAWEGRGMATAAVAAMLREAFAAPEVTAVIAHTAPGPNGSTRVLEKNGFARDGEVPDVELGSAWRFRVER